MNCPECDRQIEAYPCSCGYQPTPDAPIVRSTYRPIPDGITKEQFGVNLYDTIKTIGGMLGIDQQRAMAIHKHERYKAQELLKRRRALQVTLAQQLPTLNDREMKQILTCYPWVVAA